MTNSIYYPTLGDINYLNLLKGGGRIIITSPEHNDIDVYTINYGPKAELLYIKIKEDDVTEEYQILLRLEDNEIMNAVAWQYSEAYTTGRFYVHYDDSTCSIIKNTCSKGTDSMGLVQRVEDLIEYIIDLLDEPDTKIKHEPIEI